MKDLAIVMTSKEASASYVGDSKTAVVSQIKTIASKSVRQPFSTFKDGSKKNENEKGAEVGQGSSDIN